MEDEERSDWECARKVQGGNADAFEVLVRRHEKRIFNLLYRWLGDSDEAAEAAQEVFLAAFRAIKGFRGEASFATWIYRIGVNQAKNRRKWLLLDRQRREAARAADPLPGAAPDPAAVVEQMELHGLVQGGLDALQRDDALIILLHDLQEVGYEEIGKVLEIPLGTVKSRLHRARQALKSKLAPHFGRRKWRP